MNSDDNNTMRSPLLFVAGIVIAAAITGGAVWFVTKQPTPPAAEPVAPAAVTAETPATAPTPAAPIAAPVAPEAPAAAFTEAQKAELQNVIKEYILKNPDVLVQSLQIASADSQKAQNGRLEKVPGGLYDYPLTPYLGPKDAKLVVVEFFDYNCGFCKRVVADLMKIVGETPDVKFMFKELPILSAESEVAARYALAANKQGKYMEFHTAIMEHQGPVTQELLDQKAAEVGLDMAKLKADANGADVKAALQKNVDLARELGVQGTPFFVIGKERVPGAIGYTRLKDLIEQERAAIDPKAAVDTSAGTTDTDNTTDTGTASPNKPQIDEPITQ
jgi:protein-disulfide isomerase